MNDNLSGEIVILTGPPGSGKTTTAKALAAASAIPTVHLNWDDFRDFIKQGAIVPYLPAAHDQNKAVMNAFAKAAEAFAHGGYFVVADGVIGPWFLTPFRELGIAVHYVVLRPQLETSVSRARGRGEGLALSGPIGELHRQFASLGEFEPHAIDTTMHEPAETLAAVRAALVAGRFRLRDRSEPTR